MKSKSSIVFLSVILILAGAIITTENFSIISGVSRHWPLLLLILGCGFIILFFQQQHQDLAMIWLGSFIATLGLFFYYLNFTGWKRLGHDWPVFLGIVGLSFLLVSVFRRKMVYWLSALSFITLFLIFFLVFTISSKFWPLSLLLLGVDLLLIDYFNKKVVQNEKKSS
ncbi:MAG: hypothetical protein JXR41_05990 [Bacteroidales bacterium]|nr:hypothetical protein [Bacteroidales bacterium]MBN2762621.1 hypothetical protein [Bacteroidales bacterium]